MGTEPDVEPTPGSGSELGIEVVVRPMVVTADHLDRLAPVAAGGVTFLVDRSRPVAVLRAGDGSERVVTWSSAPTPKQADSRSIYAVPGCVWVVYAERTTDGPGSSTAVRVGTDAAVATCELGVLKAVRADADGLWICSNLYLAMRNGLSREDQGTDEVEHDSGAFPGPPLWIENTPVTSWDDFERAEREATEVHVRTDVEQ